MPVRRGQDLQVLYDRDDVSQVIAVQRTYQDTLNPTIATPITPLFIVRQQLAQQLAQQINLPPIGAVTCLRKAIVCFPNSSNAGGESNFQVILPWHPVTGQTLGQMREIKLWIGVGSITYEGESAGSGC